MPTTDEVEQARLYPLTEIVLHPRMDNTVYCTDMPGSPYRKQLKQVCLVSSPAYTSSPSKAPQFTDQSIRRFVQPLRPQYLRYKTQESPLPQQLGKQGSFPLPIPISSGYSYFNRHIQRILCSIRESRPVPDWNTYLINPLGTDFSSFNGALLIRT